MCNASGFRRVIVEVPVGQDSGGTVTLGGRAKL